MKIDNEFTVIDAKGRNPRGAGTASATMSTVAQRGVVTMPPSRTMPTTKPPTDIVR